MFMLDAVDRILDQYLDEHVLENGGYSRDEIRVEMVGPQGTCTDCQAGLTLWLTDTNKYFDNKGWPLKVSLRTRWTSGRAEMQGMRPNARDLSHTYGSLGAYPKNGLKGAADQHGFRAPAPHHKLKF